MKLRACIFILTLIGAVGASRLTEAQSEVAQVTQRVKPAIVLVQVTIEGRPLLITPEGPRYYDIDHWGGQGSGFIINPDGYLITNGHVVARVAEKDKPGWGREIENVFFRRFLARYVFPIYAQKAGRSLNASEQRQLIAQYGPMFRVANVKTSVEVALPNWAFHPAEIKRYSPAIDEGGKDIAILKIEAKNLPTVRLGDSDKLQEQDEILPVGYPGAAQNELISRTSALNPTITSGHVSSIKHDIKGTPVIQTDAAIAPGSSGGPALNRAGEVVGVSTFGSTEAAGFNFLVPVNTALEFVRELGITTNQQSLFDEIWSESLALYYGAQHRSAIAKFDDVLRLLPNYEEAKKLQLRSQEYIAQHPVRSYLNELNLMMFGGMVAVMLIIAGVVLKARKQRVVAQPEPVATVSVAREIASSSPPPPLPQQAFGTLICTTGPLAGRTFKIGRQGLLIGRDSSKCQVVLNSDQVSREHTWVVPLEGEKVVAIDRESSNGTFINSIDSPCVRKVALNPGDTIIIGQTAVAKFTFQPN